MKAGNCVYFPTFSSVVHDVYHEASMCTVLCMFVIV